jgi:hydroxymethylpyrimidine/phosphomethylpyrimidine kinase
MLAGMAPIAVTIAGSDSGGGAGIQADLKTFSALGVYGASVVTALTAQNTCAVTLVEPASPAMIAAQITAVFADLDVRAVKIGMLGDTATINTVADHLAGHWAGSSLPLVLDPVMVTTSGDALLTPDAVACLRTRLLPGAQLLTPNLPEAAALLNAPVATSEVAMLDQAKALINLGAHAVLIKGGRGEGAECLDLLVTNSTVLRLAAPRQATTNTHGTGCTLSAAVAAGLAQGMDLVTAVSRAHTYVQGAIAAADGLAVGHGHGPVHHFHTIWPRG